MGTLAQNLNSLTQAAKDSAAGTSSGDLLTGDIKTSPTADRASLLSKPSFDRSWTEPESPASVENPPVYPYNKIWQSESRHSIELDDTPGRERVRIQHRTGTFTEIHPNSDEVHKVFGDGYEIHLKNRNMLVKGVCSITVEGDSIVHTKGNKYERVDGDYILYVKGDYSVSTKRDLSIISSGNCNLGVNPTALGYMKFLTGDSKIIKGDLVIEGAVTCYSLLVQDPVGLGRIDTGPLGGVGAGLMGFTSGTGGLSLGFPTPASPLAIPVSIFTQGPIVSLSRMVSPLATFGIVSSGISDAILMTDLINTTVYNTHEHGVVAHSFTTIPFIEMI